MSNRAYVHRENKYIGSHIKPRSIYRLYLYDEEVGIIKATKEDDEYWQGLDYDPEESFRRMYCYKADEHRLLTDIFGEFNRLNFNYDLAEFMDKRDRIPTKKEWEKLKVLEGLK